MNKFVYLVVSIHPQWTVVQRKMLTEQVLCVSFSLDFVFCMGRKMLLPPLQNRRHFSILLLLRNCSLIDRSHRIVSFPFFDLVEKQSLVLWKLVAWWCVTSFPIFVLLSCWLVIVSHIHHNYWMLRLLQTMTSSLDLPISPATSLLQEHPWVNLGYVDILPIQACWESGMVCETGLGHRKQKAMASRIFQGKYLHTSKSTNNSYFQCHCFWCTQKQNNLCPRRWK